MSFFKRIEWGWKGKGYRYISELYSITVYCDIYSDELQEPVIMDDISGDVANSNIEICMLSMSPLRE